jgi:hypothetical protein
MNRTQRRELPPAIRAIADNLHAVQCADCNSDARIVHDDTLGMW